MRGEKVSGEGRSGRERDKPITGKMRRRLGFDSSYQPREVAEDVGRLELVVDVLVSGERLGLRRKRYQYGRKME
jgi:hypothetical protein